VSTSATLTEATHAEHNYANTLAAGGIPRYVKGVRQVQVAVVALDDVLAHERAGQRAYRAEDHVAGLGAAGSACGGCHAVASCRTSSFLSGVLMLKIDAQGYEDHILRGAEKYIRRRPVLSLLLEFTPKLLLSAGVQPIDLLRRIKALGYQCFDLSPPELAFSGGEGLPAAVAWQHLHKRKPSAHAAAAAAPLSVSFDEFLQRYRPLGTSFGQWTDLFCLNFALL
jgi:hypothetical protein